MRALVDGDSRPAGAIAEALEVSVRSVHHVVAAIVSRLGVPNRSQVRVRFRVSP